MKLTYSSDVMKLNDDNPYEKLLEEGWEILLFRKLKHQIKTKIQEQISLDKIESLRFFTKKDIYENNIHKIIFFDRESGWFNRFTIELEHDLELNSIFRRRRKKYTLNSRLFKNN